MKKTKNDFLIMFSFGFLLMALVYFDVINSLKYYLSDYNGHTYVYLPHFFSKEYFWEGWKAVPYCMWHFTALFFYKILRIPLEVSAAYSACVYALFSYLVFYWILQKIALHREIDDGCVKLSLLSFCLCIVQPLSFYWVDVYSFSMNPLYNPTYMCVRGFSLLCFCLAYDILCYQKNPEHKGIFFKVENGLKKHYVYLAVLLFLSVLAKPTFAEMFIPAAAFFMLTEWMMRIGRKDGSAGTYFKHCLNMLLCAVPALAYAFVQFFAYFLLGGSYGQGGSLIITGFLEVWKIHADNVALSLLLSLLFPLFMILADPRYFTESEEGKLSIFCFGIGFLEAAFLGESGQKLADCDFVWPMMSAMLILFLLSTVRLNVLENSQNRSKWHNLAYACGWFLFAAHAFSGVLYFINSITAEY